MLLLMRGDVVERMYAGHVTGTLWTCVPLLNRMMPTPNDPMYGPNV